MNWEAFLTQVLKTAGLAVIGAIATKVVSETESQLAKTRTTTANYLKLREKSLGIR